MSARSRRRRRRERTAFFYNAASFFLVSAWPEQPLRTKRMLKMLRRCPQLIERIRREQPYLLERF